MSVFWFFLRVTQRPLNEGRSFSNGDKQSFNICWVKVVSVDGIFICFSVTTSESLNFGYSPPVTVKYITTPKA